MLHKKFPNFRNTVSSRISLLGFAVFCLSAYTMSESNSFDRQLQPGRLKSASQFSTLKKIIISACHMAAISSKNGVKASNQPSPNP